MIEITDTAKEKIFELMQMANPPVKGIQLQADNRSPLHTNYNLMFVRRHQDVSHMASADFGDFRIYYDPDKEEVVDGATIDFKEDMNGSAFQVRGPQTELPEEIDGTLVEKLKDVFDEMINPALSRHGGTATLLDVRENAVYLELGGGCKGCGMVDVTLKQGIEEMIREYVPEIQKVYDVTDHASGDNPYYQPSSK